MGTAKRPDGKPYYGDDFYQVIESSQMHDILQLIEVAMAKVGEATQDRQKYTILLLIIDGDMFGKLLQLD